MTTLICSVVMAKAMNWRNEDNFVTPKKRDSNIDFLFVKEDYIDKVRIIGAVVNQVLFEKLRQEN